MNNQVTEKLSSIIGLVSTTMEPLPLLGLSLTGRLDGPFGKFCLTERFRNTTTKPIEAIYIFPLPEEAAICGFSIELTDRTLTGRVEEREKAFKRYDAAMAQGNGAYLLDQERPNVFHLSVGNLMPGQEAVIHVDFLWLANVHERGIRLMLPTTISPRYTPPHLSDEEKAEIVRTTPPYASAVPYGLSLSLEVHQNSAIRMVESPSHPIRSEILGNSAQISFSQGATSLDRDIVINLETLEPIGLNSLVTTRADRDHLLLQFLPAIPENVATMPRRLVFLIDCSGSMDGDSIQQARQAVELCLRALNEGDLFQIVQFGSRFTELFNEFLVVNQGNLDHAVARIQHIYADMGGTEILAPIQAIFDKNRAEPFDLILLTDGQVSNEAETIEYVRQHATQGRIFTFGIGAGVSEHLVRGLARQSRGEAEFIYPGERIEPKVLRQFGRISSPLFQEVMIDWGGIEVTMTPTNIPPIFAGQPLLIGARLEPGQHVPDQHRITLKAMGSADWQSWSTVVERCEENSGIPLWWARQAIRDIEEGRQTTLGSNQRRPARPSPIGQPQAETPADLVVQISEEYGLLCQQTSFIAVEERSHSEKSKEPAELHRIPVMVTTGWHGVGSVGSRRGTGCGLGKGGPALQRTVMNAMPCHFAPQPSKSSGKMDISGLFFGKKERAGFSSFPDLEEDSDGDVDTFSAPAEVANDELPIFLRNRADSDDVASAMPAEYDDLPPFLKNMKKKEAAPWYLDILGHQQANGSFEPTDKIYEAFNVPRPIRQELLAELTSSFTTNQRQILATLMAILGLRHRAAADEPAWKMAVVKAQIWLKKQMHHPGQEHELFAQLENKLKKHQLL
jgi:Ca-activated chloride channel family protein